MRKFIYLSIILLSSIIIESCYTVELESSSKKLLFAESDFIISDGIMNFRSQTTFDSLVRLLSEKDSEFLKVWENSHGFKSLRSIYERAIQEEEVFLANLVLKYGDDENLTRAKIGYSDYSKNYLQNRSLVLDDYGLVEMNVTVPSYGSLLNEDRMVKIDGKLFQFNKSEIKVISDGDIAKISSLNSINESNELRGIRVIPVSRNSIQMTSTQGRISAWNASCDNSNGNYRVIGYEEDIFWLDGCQSYWSFWIKLRSLRKILGTWQNYNTGSLSVKGNIKIIEWAVDGLPTQGTYYPPYIYRVIVDETNVTHNLPFGNTQYHYYVNQLPTSCLVYSNSSYVSRHKFYKRFYNVYGYNSTTCSFGANPFEVCYTGSSFTECPPN